MRPEEYKTRRARPLGLVAKTSNPQRLLVVAMRIGIYYCHRQESFAVPVFTLEAGMEVGRGIYLLNFISFDTRTRREWA